MKFTRSQFTIGGLLWAMFWFAIGFTFFSLRLPMWLDFRIRGIASMVPSLIVLFTFALLTVRRLENIVLDYGLARMRA